MGRIIKTIEIEGQPAVALFDTGATFTYIKEPFLATALRKPLIAPFRVALGGTSIEIRELCLIGGRIEGLGFDTDAVPVAELGEADGHELDALIGVRTMEQWAIRLDPKNGTLDLEGLRRREFTEWCVMKRKA
jgi:predicted aspartyl protease